MAYAYSYEVPADEEIFKKVNAAVGDERPDGLIAHMVIKVDKGLRHTGVFESKELFDRFQQTRVLPAVRKVLAEAGMSGPPPQVVIEEPELIDVVTR